MAIFMWDSFELFSQLAPNMRPLRLLTMIYDTKRSWDKQNESVNVGPYSSDSIGYSPPKKERKQVDRDLGT